MAKDPAFLFYPGDYLRDTQCLSEKSQVAYDRIMCEHMRNICISQDQLNFFTKRLSDEEKKELKILLTKTAAGYQIEWVVESICKRRDYSESRRKNKAGKTKNISKSYDSHMENAIVNGIGDINTNEIEKFLVPEMQEIFKRHNPKYKQNQERDYKPLLSIAEFLIDQGNLEGSPEENKRNIMIAWDPLCRIISKDKFYSTKPLSTISKQIQEITQIALHGKSNGKPDYGSPERANEYDRLFTERYGKGGSAVS